MQSIASPQPARAFLQPPLLLTPEQLLVKCRDFPHLPTKAVVRYGAPQSVAGPTVSKAIPGTAVLVAKQWIRIAQPAAQDGVSYQGTTLVVPQTIGICWALAPVPRPSGAEPAFSAAC